MKNKIVLVASVLGMSAILTSCQTEEVQPLSKVAQVNEVEVITQTPAEKPSNPFKGKWSIVLHEQRQASDTVGVYAIYHTEANYGTVVMTDDSISWKTNDGFPATEPITMQPELNRFIINAHLINEKDTDAIDTVYYEAEGEGVKLTDVSSQKVNKKRYKFEMIYHLK